MVKSDLMKNILHFYIEYSPPMTILRTQNLESRMKTDQSNAKIEFFAQYWLVLLLIGIVSTLHYLTPHGNHGSHAGHVMESTQSFDWNAAFHGIYRRLYYFPIILAAFRGGMRGGFGASLLVVAIYLPHAFAVEWGLNHWVMADPGMRAEKILEILLYLAMGLVAGQLVERLNLTSRNLSRTAKNLQHTLDEKIAVEQELVRSARLAAVGRLSAGLAHEIRNPLASIQGAAEVLTDDFPPDNPKRRLIDILLQETERLNQVLTRFLEFARSTPGDLKRIDLVQEVKTVVELLTNQKDIPQLVVKLPATCKVRGNSEEVRQILVNVILNAVAIDPSGQPIQVVVAETSGVGQIRVMDSGPGFSSEALENFGTPFYSSRHGGTGLGLATSLRTAENMGGTLSVDEEYKSGACVVLNLALDDNSNDQFESELS